MNAKGQKLFRLVQTHAGISRRKAQELIEAGEVTLNGEVVEDPFYILDLQSVTSLHLRGHPLSMDQIAYRTYRYYKPEGVLCSHDDPHYGNTVGRILRAEGFIGYTWAGRLDQDAEGLILLTNDGELIHVLTHPRYEVEKVYHVWLSSCPSRKAMNRMFEEMRAGIENEGETLRILRGEPGGRSPHAALTLVEGKKREIKRLFAHYKLGVTRLKRVAIGPTTLSELEPGRFSRLEEGETQTLYRYARRHGATSLGTDPDRIL
jgi:23S rRNA pseudouridine2605 synthase